MNTNVCEHYGLRICSYFWDKLMKNSMLLHKIVICMKTASCQIGFHKIYYHEKFVLHMLKCWLHVNELGLIERCNSTAVWIVLSTTPFQPGTNIWPTTKKIRTLGFEQPITSLAYNKIKLQKLQISQLKKQ